MIIKEVKAREVLDSRGNPTVEAEITVNHSVFSAIVPSGASTGKYEAVELRDNERRYNGKGVLKAVSNINNIISKKIIGMDPNNQKEIDKIMIDLDGTKNKSQLGANSILAVSMACCKAAASSNNMGLYEYIAKISGNKGKTLPIPMMNVINGGKHAGMENDIQEQMIMPIKSKNFSEALQSCAETYHNLKGILKKKFGSNATLLGDEGGFAPKFNNFYERIETIIQAIEESGYGDIMKLALDSASSEFFNNNKYKIMDKSFDSGELIDFYSDIIKRYNLISIEDGMAEDDWQGWKELTKRLGNKIQIVGDDLLVTNVDRIKKAIKEKSCNALLLKVNQIGTVTESIDAANLAFKNNWNVVVSHRSGETEDSFIADLAVGLDAGQCKFGAPARSERNAKYNQLLRIEENLQNPLYRQEIFK